MFYLICELYNITRIYYRRELYGASLPATDLQSYTVGSEDSSYLNSFFKKWSSLNPISGLSSMIHKEKKGGPTSIKAFKRLL